MERLSKQIAIFTGLFLVYSTFTMIFPFYPKIALDKGVPFWMIGFIFSLKSIANLIISPILGKYMNRLGRKNIMASSFLFISASMALLSPIQICDKTTLIILSVFAMICGGMGAGCLLNSATTVFTSDYPDQLKSMIGRMEACIGLGLILGPVIGTALSQVNFFFAFMTMCITILIFTPIAWKLLGKFRPYDIRSSSISKISLLLKPRIFLTLLMNTTFLFSFGLVQTILEIHLSSFDIGRLYISLCFVLQSAVYLISSLTAGHLFKRADERMVMIVGVAIIAISYTMIGPWRAIFPNKVSIVILALPLLSIGQSFTYMFTIPFIIKTASSDYSNANDDKLSDTVSSIAVLAGAFGDILGPLYAGFVSGEIGIEKCCAIAAAATIAFDIVFLIGTDCFCRRRQYSAAPALPE